MRKLNSVKKIAVAAALASTMAVQAFGITASATDYYLYNGVYYTSSNDAYTYGGSGYTSSSNPNLYGYYYNSYTHGYYPTESSARNASPYGYVTYNSNSYNYNYGNSQTASGTYLYHNTATGLYYTNYESARAATTAGDVETSSGIPKAWFCSKNGTYYNSYDEAYGAAAHDTSKVVRVTNYADNSNVINYDYDHTYATYYYSSKTGDYYLSWSEARNASNSDSEVSTHSTTSYNLYFCQENGHFYSSKAQALSYANNDDSKVEYYGYSPTSYNYYDDYYYNGRYYDSNYYNGRYYNYYGGRYDDPYYYYFSNFGSGSSSSTTYGNADNGDAYLSGNKKKAGWSYIKSYIKEASSKATITINMNQQDSVPDDVLEQLKGTRKTLVLVKSGIKYSIYGADVDNAYSTNLAFATSSRSSIPSKLVNKVSKGASYRTRFTIGREGTFGFDATTTIKFNKNRAGYKVTFYRYDSANDRLVSVGTTTVASDGTASFTASAGGSYIAILK